MLSNRGVALGPYDAAGSGRVSGANHMVTRGIDRPSDLTDLYYIAVIHADALTLTQRMMGVICSEEADEHGRITDASVGDIAKRWNVARRSMVDHIAALVKHGWLFRESKPGKESHYELRIPGQNSNSNVSRETNSNVIGITRGILIAAEFLSTEHGWHMDSAIALAEYVKATIKPRSLIAYLRRIPYSDLLALLDDAAAASALKTGHVVSIPRQANTYCPIHPDNIGGTTQSGGPRCPICRANAKGQDK